jgi:hypothetical protein
MTKAKIFFVAGLAIVLALPASATQAKYAGFWKTQCSLAFGLQIAPVSESLYSVSFCGPGGCFMPGTYRPNTPIEGDPLYEVVSSSEIKVRASDASSITYHKCTSNTHPALRYPADGV